MIKIGVTLNERQGQCNSNVMLSRDWGSQRVKFDSYRFTGFWDVAGDGQTDRLLGLANVTLLKYLWHWKQNIKHNDKSLFSQVNRVIISLSISPNGLTFRPSLMLQFLRKQTHCSRQTTGNVTQCCTVVLHRVSGKRTLIKCRWRAFLHTVAIHQRYIFGFCLHNNNYTKSVNVFFY